MARKEGHTPTFESIYDEEIPTNSERRRKPSEMKYENAVEGEDKNIHISL
jgi:hypothetical protein